MHRDFHQVDIYFRCTVTSGMINQHWKDPEGVVNQRRLFTRDEMSTIRYKPDSLSDVAWATEQAITYDPLEPLVR